MINLDLDAIRAGDQTDLRDADLRHADLWVANLRDADLKDADLRDADLRDANLWGAYLWHANLRDADLWGADLRDADLRHANLWGAYLGDADLRDADLRDANLWGADLRDADLRHANLWVANLWGADLRDADLNNATLPDYERLPEHGAFVAFKGTLGHVVKLSVPADADRTSSLTGTKCRAEFVEVVEVLDAEGEPCDATEATGWYDDSTVYREGETVHPDDWDDDIRIECTHGIHLYPTLREAVGDVRGEGA